MDSTLNITSILSPDINETYTLTCTIINQDTGENTTILSDGGDFCTTLDRGFYNAWVKFLGTNIYNESTVETGTFEIPGEPTILQINNISFDEDNAIIETQLIDKNGTKLTKTITVQYRYNETSNWIHVPRNRMGQYIIYDLKKGTFQVSAIFSGTEKYAPSSSITSVTFEGEPSILKVNAPVIEDTANITINLTDDKGNLINDKVQVNIMKNGMNITSFELTNNESYLLTGLSKGTYILEAEYSGSDTYADAIETTTFNTNGYPSKLEVIVTTGDNTATIKVNLTDENGTPISDKVNIELKNSTYDVIESFNLTNNENNTVSLKIGEYTVIAYYTGSEIYTDNTATQNLKIQGKESEVTCVEKTDENIVNITINLYDVKDSHPIDGENITVIVSKDFTEIKSFNLTNGGNYAIGNLTRGEYNVSATYSGSDTYKSAQSIHSFVINGITPNLTAKITPYENVANITINLTDRKGNPILGENITITIYDSNNVEVDSFNLTNGQSHLTQNLKRNMIYSVHARYVGSDIYSPTFNIWSFTVEGIPTQLIVTPKTSDNTVETHLNLTDHEGNPISKVNITIRILNASAMVIKSFNVTTNENGEANKIFTGLNNGDYTVNALFNGTDIYDKSYNSQEFVIDVGKTATSLNIGFDVVNDNATIYINLTDNNSHPISGENITLELFNDGKTIKSEIVSIQNGKGNKTFTGLDNGKYIIKAIFTGTDLYDASEDSEELIVFNGRIPTKLNINTETINNTGIIGLNLTDQSEKPINGTVKLSITSNNGYSNSTLVNIVDGKGIYTLSDLSDGMYNVFGNFNGTETYGSSTNYNYFIISNSGKIATIISIKTEITNDTVHIYLSLADTYGNLISGNLTVNVTSNNGYKHDEIVQLKNGLYILTLHNLIDGIYNITSTYNVSEDYDESFNSTLFEIGHIPPEYYLNASDVVKYYKNGTQYIVKLTDQYDNPVAGKVIIITLSSSKWPNSKSYNIVTNASGVATLDINLLAGKYSIVANFMNATPEINNITVLEVTFVLTADNVIKYFMNGTHYTVTVTSQFGYIIPNEIVNVKVYSTKWLKPAVYTIKTNSSGVAKLDINLIAGIYTISATAGKTTKYNNIAVYPTLTAESITKKVNEEANLKANLVDGQGNPVANKIVKFTVKAKTYYLTTDANGIATLPIHLGLGTWSFLIASDNSQTRATVKVIK